MRGPVYMLLPKFGGDFLMLDSSSFSHPQSEDILLYSHYIETNKLNQLIKKKKNPVYKTKAEMGTHPQEVQGKQI